MINVKLSWVTELQVRNLLCNCAFAEVWYNQGVGNYEDFLKVATERIYDIGMKSYSNRLNLVFKYFINLHYFF